MVPRLGDMSPRTARIKVVFPEPFGPSTPTNSRGPDVQAYGVQNDATANRQTDVAKLDCMHGCYFGTA
jgi:hypothetical protein